MSAQCPICGEYVDDLDEHASEPCTLDEQRTCIAGTPHCASLHVDVDSPCEPF